MASERGDQLFLKLGDEAADGIIEAFDVMRSWTAPEVKAVLEYVSENLDDLQNGIWPKKKGKN